MLLVWVSCSYLKRLHVMAGDHTHVSDINIFVHFVSWFSWLFLSSDLFVSSGSEAHSDSTHLCFCFDVSGSHEKANERAGPSSGASQPPPGAPEDLGSGG